MYFEDFYEGYCFKTGKRKLLKEELISFAKVWDYQSFHIEQAWQRKQSLKV